MEKSFEYYYNDVPGKGLCRNNLIYTSLISTDKTVFCKWYHNDTEYHKGKNQVVDSSLMEEKWLREVNYITQMRNNFPSLVPRILKIDLEHRKLYLEIEGDDFWQLSDPVKQNYDSLLPDWREQMLGIFQAHRDLGIYKYSLHPSSYFVVSGKLKSINYFFCYRDTDAPISVKDVISHISEDRQKELIPKMQSMNIDISTPTSFKQLQILAFESFKNNFPHDFIEEAKKIYE